MEKIPSYFKVSIPQGFSMPDFTDEGLPLPDEILYEKGYHFDNITEEEADKFIRRVCDPNRCGEITVITKEEWQSIKFREWVNWKGFMNDGNPESIYN
jgi:hypothetical protein